MLNTVMPEDKGLPVFNYSIAYVCNNREPLFYEDYPGSIVDVSQLQCMLDKALVNDAVKEVRGTYWQEKCWLHWLL